jgi:hypothetical protein
MSIYYKFIEFVRQIWARIAAFLIVRWLRTSPDPPLDFSRLIEDRQNWLLIMPAEANAFETAMTQGREFLSRMIDVRFYLLVPNAYRHWVQAKPDLKVLPYDRKDLFLGRFPRSTLLKRLRKIHPAVALDLCPRPSPLSLIVCGLCGARVRGALARPQGDAVFNLLIKSGARDLGERYRALFAYLS